MFQFARRIVCSRFLTPTLGLLTIAGILSPIAFADPQPGEIVRGPYGVGGAGAEWSTRGTLTSGDKKDDIRTGCYRHVWRVYLLEGNTYQVDLTSGDGSSRSPAPPHFDTFLRVDDSRQTPLRFGTGGIVQNDDVQSGSNFNSRVVFRAGYSGHYHLIVTTYRPGAVGNYALRVYCVQ
jgi:hypothetical protein